MNETMSGTDPWSPVDESRTTVNEVQPETPLEVRGGEVTAHINLGGDTTPPDEKPAEEESTEDTESEETAAEVESAEDELAKKLAALDAARPAPAKKTKK